MPSRTADRRTCIRWAAGLALITVALALVFRLAGGLDLGVSRLFYTPEHGFTFADVGVWEAVLATNKVASALFVVAGFVLLAMALLRRNSLALRYWSLAVLLYLLGPGLLVNMTLKRVFGRARPAQIEEFGGDGPFTAAWQVSDYCRSSCSFVSAETSVATALALLLAIGAVWFAGRPAGRAFRVLAWPAFGLLILTALQRIGSGRHFLSDIAFSALLVTLLGLLLACLLSPRTSADRDAPTEGPTG